MVEAFAAADPTTDRELIETTLGAVADLGPDGDDACRELSVDARWFAVDGAV